MYCACDEHQSVTAAVNNVYWNIRNLIQNHNFLLQYILILPSLFPRLLNGSICASVVSQLCVLAVSEHYNICHYCLGHIMVAIIRQSCSCVLSQNKRKAQFRRSDMVLRDQSERELDSRVGLALLLGIDATVAYCTHIHPYTLTHLTHTLTSHLTHIHTGGGHRAQPSFFILTSSNTNTKSKASA